MKNIISKGLVLLLAVFLSGGSTGSSAKEFSNVKCAIPKFEPAFEQAAAVFVGRVLSKKSEGPAKIFELEVDKYWKGVDAKKIIIYVNENPRYEAQFEIGKSYLVFAENDENDSGKLFDRRCSRTKLIQTEFGDLEEDLEKLGEAKTCFASQGLEICGNDSALLTLHHKLSLNRVSGNKV